MLKTTINRYITLLQKHPKLVITQKSKARYIVEYLENRWEIWPMLEKYRYLGDPSKQDYYYGDIRHFYVRYIACSVSYPENHAKKWTREEEDSLLDMINFEYSVNQIANDLERHPRSIVAKIALVFDDRDIQTRLYDSKVFDVAVISLICC